MKTKRRTVNTDVKVCNKKIITRNMLHKIVEDKISSTTTNGNNLSINKPSPVTRAKSNAVVKSEVDPYSFSKMDEDCKLPIKKIKMTEKTGKDVAVNTSSFSTMTDPELLGPCEPGTSIELQGIVWLETETGLLVINVTWRGRTYVGTLLDSTKYEFSPPFNSHIFPGKFENRHVNRTIRGKKRYVPPCANNHTSPRINNIRHSQRLSESLSYQNNTKKLSTRLATNGSCYIDTLSLSAEASQSGESDSELNNYQKYSPGSKTRSITRSLAKQNNAVTNKMEIESSNNLLQCSQANCFKKFTDDIGLQYHLQRTHDIFEEVKKTDNVNNLQNSTNEKFIKTEEQDPMLVDCIQSISSKLNGIIKRDNDNFEFNSDSEIEKCDEKRNPTFSDKSIAKKAENNVAVNNILVEMENDKTKLSDNITSSPETLLLSSGSTEIVKSHVSDDKEKSQNPLTLLIVDHPPKKSTSNILKTVNNITTDNVTTSTTIIRTVSAPTVSIPIESSTSISSNNPQITPTTSPALIKPKPILNLSSVSHSSQSKKLKPLKTLSNTNTNQNSFQIPSSNTLSKKRPLIPLKVSVNQNVISSQSRVLSNSSINTISPNHSSRHIRSSTFSSVTPILPATSISNLTTSIISNSLASSGQCSISTAFLNNSLNTKRPIVTSSSASSSGMTSILSLKPIQPKPKSTNIPSTYSTTTSTSFVNTLSTTNLPGIISTQTSYQRQILPSPVTKTENGNNSDDKLIHKVDSLKSTSIKKKRRKPDKKMRINFHEGNRIQKIPLNPIQPKHNKNYPDFICQQNDISSSVDNYKMNEENSHSPEYSDLSETNDTPAPILEKEVELKSGDCDKLIICTDFEPTSTKRIRSSSSDHSLYNKPPALMPAVLSTDLLNGSTNDIDLSGSQIKTGRRKTQIHKNSPNYNDPSKELSKCSSETDFPTFLRHNNTITSSRKSFQSSSFDEQTSPSLFSSSNASLYNSSQNEFHNIDQKPKLKLSKSSNLSAINDYVWMTKNSQDSKTKSCVKLDEDLLPPKTFSEGDCGKKKVFLTQSQPTNGRFSVQALTSPQEMVSRPLTTSSTVITVNPNTKSVNSFFKK